MPRADAPLAAPATSPAEPAPDGAEAKAAFHLRLRARGVALLVPALAAVPVAEYSANLIKKTVTGAGLAEKTQVQMMVKVLLPRCELPSADAADALAVAITHAQLRAARRRTAMAAAR